MNIFQLEQYKGSRDYARLAELAMTTSVICLIDYQDCRDVAHTLYQDGGDLKSWQVSARGQSYISAFDTEQFIRRCEALNVEFLEPTPVLSAPRPEPLHGFLGLAEVG